jgi:putative glycosyltransferase
MLICITSLTGGGAEKSLVNFVQEFESMFEISILVYTEKNNFYGSKLSHLRIDYFIRKNTPAIIEKIVNKLVKFLPPSFVNRWIIQRSIFKNEKFDYEFAYIEGKPTKIIAGSSNKDSLKLAYIHCDFSKNWYSKRSFKNYKEELICYQKFNSILAVSNPQKESFEEIFPKTSLEVIPNLLNIDEIKNLSKEEIELENTPYFCAIGRLELVKNFELLINAFHLFRKKYSQYHLIILGDGSLNDHLKNQINNLGESQYIKLLGFQPNPYKYIKNSVGLIQSSVSESFSYVLAEAAVLGIPSISTKTQGSEVMAEYFEVIQVEHTSNELAKGLEKVIANNFANVSFNFNEEAYYKFLEIFKKGSGSFEIRREI